MSQLVSPAFMMRVLALSFVWTISLVLVLWLTGSWLGLLVWLALFFVATIAVGVRLGLKLRRDLSTDPEAVRRFFSGTYLIDGDSAGAWGFRASSGVRVGGGLFTAIALDQSEQVLRSSIGSYSTNRWLASHGYVTLTDARVLFTAYAFHFLWRRVALPYTELESAWLERRLNAGAFSGSLLKALVLHQKTGKTHFFWTAGLAETLLPEILSRMNHRT